MAATKSDMATVKLSGVGALYKRVSTDKQDSERQDDTLNRWLTKQGAEVSPDMVFVDEGWARADAAQRPDWQRLLNLVDEGKVNWIAVDVQDRMESRDKYETAATIHRLRKAKAKLFTADDREVTAGDISSFLQTGLASDTSEKELIDKSKRVLEGKQLLALAGQWMGGKVPYAMDVVSVRMNAQGDPVEQWRVVLEGTHLRVKHIGGEAVRYDGPQNFPSADKLEIFQLRPTLDTHKLDIVRMIFERFANSKVTPSTLARLLNTEGITPPPLSTQWYTETIKDILTNTIYIGRPLWNRRTSGEYSEFIDGNRKQKERDTKPKRHARKDWIIADAKLFEPVVDVELFDKVQGLVDALVKDVRAPVNDSYLFSGLVFCANCGGKMVGSKLERKKLPKSQWPLTYLCSSYNAHKGARATCPCKAYRVHQSQLLDAVQSYVDEIGPVVGSIGNSVRGKTPTSLQAAFLATFTAWNAMAMRVDKEYGKGCLSDVDDDLLDDALEGLYRRWFASGSQQSIAKLEQLDAEHTRLSLQASPTARAKAKVEERLTQLEAEMAELESETRNHADIHARASAEASALLAAWQQASEAVSGSMTQRQRAGAIAKVIARINVKSVPTGLASPASAVESIEIIPVDVERVGRYDGLRGVDIKTPSP